MTHVLNQALRHVLIPPSSQQTIDQKGSLNDQTKLRFDFSYSGPISPDHLLAVEKFCQSSIAAGHPVRTSDVSLSLARPISSLRAVFGEAYPDPVRVVSIGPHAIEDMMERPSDPAWMGDSVEFCGGTHLANTALAEHFVLLNEEGIAKGIRRITAVTKDEAREALRLSSDFGIRLSGVETEEDGCLETFVKVLVEELKGLSIGAPAKLGYQTRLTALTKRVLKWKKARVALLSQEVTAFVLQRETATPSDKIVLRYDFGTDAKIAKTVMTAHVKKGKKPLLLISAEGDKFIVLACAPKSFQDKKFDCKQWIVAGLGDLEGRGGGKKDAALYTVLKAEGMDLVLDNAKLY